MGKALAALFSFFTTLFNAMESGAKTVDNIAGVGELRSRIYLDEATHDVAMQQLKLDKAIKAELAALPAPEAK